MIFYPNIYFENVREITITFLQKNNIKALILDVDNTLIDFDKNLPEETITWCKELQGQGIKFCILSNSNKVEKVKTVAQKLGIHYFYFGTKPFKRGFNKAVNYIKEQNPKIKNENIAAVGDQIFTDIVGANRMKMFSILVKPIATKDLLVTRIKRPLENKIIKSWQKSLEKSKNESRNKNSK